MLADIKCVRIDASESNFASAFLSLLSSCLAVASLVNDEWIVVDDDLKGPSGSYLDNRSHLEKELTRELIFFRAARCQSIGTSHFWRSARFGAFTDIEGNTHTAYHSNSKVLIDCITPLISDFFYILIALCFVAIVASSLACVLNILAPPAGFLQWIRRNTILEICNMILTLLASITSLLAESQVSTIRQFSTVSAGPGLFLIAASGLLALSAATISLRRTGRISRERRIENQRILCARSLRSWRDIGHRSEDTIPIIDFERYLESSAVSPLEIIPSSHINTTRFEQT